MHTLGKLLGLALLEIVVCLAWSMFAMFFVEFVSAGFQENVWIHLAVSVIPVTLMGILLARLWGLWRADWLVRLTTTAICLVIPFVFNIPLVAILFWHI